MTRSPKCQKCQTKKDITLYKFQPFHSQNQFDGHRIALCKKCSHVLRKYVTMWLMECKEEENEL